MDMRRLVGRNVERIRRLKDMTQEELAVASGFSQQYLSGLERGRRNPTIVTIYEIANALGVGYLDLLAGGNEDTVSRCESTEPRRGKLT